MNDQRARQFIEGAEDFLVRWSFVVSIMLSILSGLAHYAGILINLRVTAGNVIMYASAVIAVIGVFLTLVVSLQDTPTFARLREHYPHMQRKLLGFLHKEIALSIILLLFSVIISSLPVIPNKWISSIGVVVWFFFLWETSIGVLYAVKLILDLASRNIDQVKRTPRQ